MNTCKSGVVTLLQMQVRLGKAAQQKWTMMRRAFSLLEILVVIVIIGILSALGINHFIRSVEKSRSSEARAVIGVIRGLALSHWNEYSTLLPGAPNNFNAAQANIGAASGNIPSAARNSHFFTYAVGGIGANTVTITATRCSNNAACKGGLMPAGGESMWLVVSLPDGQDTGWQYSANAPWR